MDDKYLHYSLTDFLEDDDFIAKVKSGSFPQDRWQKSLADRPETLDAFKMALKLIQQLRFNEEKISSEKVEALWAKISNNTQGKKQHKKVIWLRTAALSGVAAVVLVLIMWMGSFLGKHKQISTYAGEHISYTLPDESSIQLNSVSYIHFNPKEFDEDRLIEMEGEVRFKVKKGGSFRVKTKMGEVQVLGTVFNVYHRNSLFEVKCFEGKVQVITNNRDTVLLRAKDAVRIDQSDEMVQQFVLEDKDLKDWSSGLFRYEDSPLNLVFEELERQFNIGIDMENDNLIRKRSYTGAFSNDNLEEALHSVCWPLRLQYEINGQQVLIKEP